MFYFSKMQATGNDFVIINNLEGKIEYSYKLLAQFLCNRHFGVGADGIIIIEKSIVANCKMRILNSDGSEAEMCGNGIRCIAKYIKHNGLVLNDKALIETNVGIKDIEYLENNKIKVSMGSPIFDFMSIPVYYIERYEEKLLINDRFYYPVSFGNPHCVSFVDNVDKLDVEKIGKIVENYKYFPNKTNVEFVEILNNQKIKIRIWERGVGETLSCGTGVCAASVIFKKYKSTESRLIVETRGGNLETEITENNIFLIGEAENIFDGYIKI